MRMIALAALSLAACAPKTAPANADGSMAGNPTTDAAPPSADPLRGCDGSKADTLIGRTVDAALQAEARKLVGAGTVRVIPPGAAVTMDYRGNRLNIETDAGNKATAFRCG